MKIINKEEIDYISKKNVWYEFDSLKTVDEIIAVLNSLEKQGYSITEYSIDLDHDHTDFIRDLNCYSIEELLKMLNKLNIDRVNALEFISEYEGIRVNGAISPSSNKLRLSYPQKKNEMTESSKLR